MTFRCLINFIALAYIQFRGFFRKDESLIKLLKQSLKIRNQSRLIQAESNIYANESNLFYGYI